MAVDTLQILSATMFGAVLLVVVALYWLFVDGTAGRRTMRRRLGAQPDAAVRSMATEALRRRSPWRDGLLARIEGRAGWLDRLVRQAGLEVSARSLGLIVGAVSAAVAGGTTAVTGSSGIIGITVTILAALIIGCGMILAAVMWFRARRMAHLAGQLPDALDIMVRSLRAGHPVTAAMAMVSREMGDPVGTEFGRTVSAMTYGLDLRDALARLAEQAPVPDLHYVTVAINIQHETGGNLAEVLLGLSTAIRARMRMRKKIGALSAEGRLSARVLAVMPIVFTGLVYLTRPEYYLVVADDPLFFPIVCVAAGLELVGILIMWRMVALHV